MTCILTELRASVSCEIAKPLFLGKRNFQEILSDAADEIESLRARVAELDAQLDAGIEACMKEMVSDQTIAAEGLNAAKRILDALWEKE